MIDLGDQPRSLSDLAFHRRIAEATGNDLLACIGNMLALALRESIRLSSKPATGFRQPRTKLTLLLSPGPNPQKPVGAG